MSYTRDVLDYLVARPGIDVDGLELARIGGAYAWRSRVAEARLLLEASGRGTIENRQTRMGQRMCSRYRYVPSPTHEAEPDPRLDEWWHRGDEDDERGPRGLR